MKKLSKQEIMQFADVLSFTESEAKDISDLFYKIKMENPINHWKVVLPLNDVNDYIREWENHWHRENNLEECFEYERENNYYDYTEEILSSIESFEEYAMDPETQFVYQLPNNKMIVVVC